MSLMQLLTVGRSFRAVQDRPTSYKMTEQRLLPRFGGRGGADSSDSSVALVRDERVVMPLLRVRERREVAVPGRWLVLGNPFKRELKASPLEGPVQGELRLNAVRVVRNDLMETDFELVPAPVVRVDDGAKAGWVRCLVRRMFGSV